jgi:hypothetical protein
MEKPMSRFRIKPVAGGAAAALAGLYDIVP